MMPIFFHPLAENEINYASDYYNAREPGLGFEFLNEIEISLKKIQETPKTWSTFMESFKKFLLHRFPYIIYYEIRENCIYIISVSHQKQKPMYWKNRT